MSLKQRKKQREIENIYPRKEIIKKKKKFLKVYQS